MTNWLRTLSFKLVLVLSLIHSESLKLSLCFLMELTGIRPLKYFLFLHLLGLVCEIILFSFNLHFFRPGWSIKHCILPVLSYNRGINGIGANIVLRWIRRRDNGDTNWMTKRRTIRSCFFTKMDGRLAQLGAFPFHRFTIFRDPL